MGNQEEVLPVPGSQNRHGSSVGIVARAATFLSCAPLVAVVKAAKSIGGRQLRPIQRAMQHAELMPKREVLQVACGLRLEGRRRSSGQHVKRTERQIEELTEETQALFLISSNIYDRHSSQDTPGSMSSRSRPHC